MEFVHSPYEPGETIAAIATPPGEGGIAIIRISGDRSLEIADTLFSGPVKEYKTHTAHFGRILDASSRTVDEALLLVLLGLRSFTGEDTVEIHCHGGRIVSQRVLEVVIAAGARAARPGEFSFRAFINGKVDLAQAEAIQELIGSKNKMALDAAESHLAGRLSIKISLFQKQLTHILAMLEAWVDFPEEDIEFASLSQVCKDVELLKVEMERLVETFSDGKIISDGISLCIVGCPNVGKSSLMNALLDKDRAIVTHIAGTTRDILEDHMRLNGLNVRLIDTAGIRDSDEIVEAEGIRRSKKAMQEADLVLLVLDVQSGLNPTDHELLAQVPKNRTVAVWNKSDLPYGSLPQLSLDQVVMISAREREGIEKLHAAVDRVIWDHGPPPKDELVITNVRHKDALMKAITATERLLEGLREKASPEFLALDARETLNALGQIIGTNITEDLLSAIFSSCCIGK